MEIIITLDLECEIDIVEVIGRVRRAPHRVLIPISMVRAAHPATYKVKTLLLYYRFD